MAATELLRLLVDADTRGAVSGLERLGSTSQREIGRSEQSLDRWGNRLTSVGAGMLTFGSAALFGLVNAGQAASDLNESASKSATVFGAAAGEVAEFAENAADIGLSERAAHDAAGTFGNLLTQVGLSTDRAADMSIAMTRLASDFASFHNADISEVIEAQTAAFRGEYDALQRFVPTINAAAVEQQAMAETGKENADSLTAAEKAAAVYTLMIEGAGAAQGDFERTSDSAANMQRRFSATLENFKATLGEGVLPIMQRALGLGTSLAGGLMELDEATGGLVGQTAAYGSVALLAAGGTSVLIGQVLKARQNFAAAWEGAKSLVGTLRTMGPTMLGVTAAVGVGVGGWMLYQRQQEQNRKENQALQDSLKETEGALTGVTRELVLEPFQRWEEKLNDLGVTSSDLIDALNGDEAAIRKVTAASFEMGNAGVGLRATLEAGTASVERNRKELEEHAEFTGGARSETGAFTTAMDQLRGAFDGSTDATEESTDALKEYSDTVHGLADPLFAFNDALNDQVEANLRIHDAEVALAEAQAEHGATSREAQDAARDLQQAYADAGESAIDYELAAAELTEAVETGRVTQQDANAMLDRWVAQGAISGDAADRLRERFGYLIGTAQTLGQQRPNVVARVTDNASGPIFDIINRLADLDGRSARVTVDAFGVAHPGGSIRLFQRGGVVPGPKGSPQVILAHGGETVFPTHDDAEMRSFAARTAHGNGVSSVAGLMGGQIVNVYLSVHGSVLSERELVGVVSDAMRNGAFRGLI